MTDNVTTSDERISRIGGVRGIQAAQHHRRLREQILSISGTEEIFTREASGYFFR